MMTPAEVAERYRVGYDTVITWIKTGKLAALNISTGRRPKYRIKSEALAALEEKLVAAPQAPVTRQKQASYVRYV